MIINIYILTDVVNANIDVLFCSPESLMTDFGRELLTSTLYQESTCVLAFDEAHCIVEWFVVGLAFV